MSSSGVSGPIDLLVLEFPADADRHDTAVALLDLVDSGVVRLLDLMVVRKLDDGTVTELRAADADFAALAGARSGLVDEDDLNDITKLLDPGTVAAVLVYENAWAVPFVAAAKEAGGQLVASSRLTAQEIIDALDATDSER